MAKPLFMHQIKRIIELCQEGHGIKKTMRLTGLSRNTVRDYLKRISSSGLRLEQLLAMDDETLKLMVYPEAIELGQTGRKVDTRYENFSKKAAHYSSELRRCGVTRQLLWEEYRKDNPQGYSYSQFCDHLKEHRQKDQAVMHFTHRAGEQMQVDFAGDKISYLDSTTGEMISCEVLVCVLPYSNYMYVEALHSQKQEDFINGLTNALRYFGGVPLSIKCDNMRTAVVKASRYEPEFTEAMNYLAVHYSTTIMAARVRKPRDKSSVEKGVDLAYKRIYAPLRDQVFHSLRQVNTAMRTQLDMFNGRPFQNKAGSRKEWFETEEKPVLKMLPPTEYQIVHAVMAKVQRNYHVVLGEDRHQYSVPYTFIGKTVKIIYTLDTVEVYDELKRIAIYSRNYTKYGYSTEPAHMPSSHQHVAQQRGWNAEYFLHKAAGIGEGVRQVIEIILKSKDFLEQTFNSCLGILSLGKKYGNDRLEAACQRALTSPRITYGVVANILKNGLDQVKPTPDTPIPPHDQIRGPQSYQ